MRRTRFIKAHACGNDFLVVERQGAAASEDEAALAVKLCARHTGVGADGVEFLRWAGEHAGAIRLYNADGSVAEISGNGTRCVAAVIAEAKGMGAGGMVTLATDAGVRECRVMAVAGEGRYEIATGMGVPVVEPGTVLPAGAEGLMVAGAVVSTGNPHFVIFVEDESFGWHGMEWEAVGRAICGHPQFPEQTNVEFVHVRSSEEIAIRIFERGVGPTSSSGTGSCAAAAASRVLHGGAARLRVEAPGGVQVTEWQAPEDEMVLTGPATLIARGEALL
ncbi:MAG TPA: diaminopimelate epimerase [Acidobacteriaceae bacterium]